LEAFPDDFHLRTLEALLQACSQLQGGVNIKSILVSLIDRLASFAGNETIPSDIKIFEIFSGQVTNVVEVRVLKCNFFLTTLETKG
jgi:vacuolar protein sorting-associated protein 35